MPDKLMIRMLDDVILKALVFFFILFIGRGSNSLTLFCLFVLILLQLAGGIVLGVALWLQHDTKTTHILSASLEDQKAPNTFYVGKWRPDCTRMELMVWGHLKDILYMQHFLTNIPFFLSF